MRVGTPLESNVNVDDAADNSAPRGVNDVVEGKGKNKEGGGISVMKLTPPLTKGLLLFIIIGGCVGPPPPPPAPTRATSPMLNPAGNEILPFGRLNESGSASEGARTPLPPPLPLPPPPMPIEFLFIGVDVTKLPFPPLIFTGVA